MIRRLIYSLLATGILTVGAVAQGVVQSPNLFWATPLSGTGYLGLRSIGAADLSSGVVSNAALANASDTVNGVVCTLGSACTVTAAAGTLTGATLAANVLTTSITGTGALTSGSTAAGFTLALGTSTLTGNVPVNHGGTGAATFATGVPLVGNGTSPLSSGTVSGNTTKFVTQGLAQTSGTCAQYDANGNITSSGAGCAGSSINALEHGGRLTLVAGGPVMVSNSAAQTTLYYAPYKSPFIAIYNGTNVTNYQFTSGPTDAVGLSLATFGSGWAANTVYDVFATLSGGVPVLCTGPAWTDFNTRAAAGSLAIYTGQLTNSNASAMTCRTSNSTTISVPQRQATYLGTILTDAAVKLNFIPQQPNLCPSTCGSFAPAVLYVWNNYNRVLAYAYVFDTATTAIQYSSTTIRTAAGNVNNRIYYVVGQVEDSCTGWYQSFDIVVNTGGYIIAGMGFSNATSPGPLTYTAGGTFNAPSAGGLGAGINQKGVASSWWSSACYPVGLNYEEALESSDGNATSGGNYFNYFGQQVLNFTYSM